MKKYIFIITIFISTYNFAQIKISGIVRDSIGNPLEMANVIAMNTLDNTLEGYSITDAKGFYKIKIAKPSTIELKVSYLGFDSQTKILVIGEQETTKDFVLTETNSDLDAVEITYEMPVTIKGDTIVYNADSFTSGKEKKLGDVLKKIPGMEVNTDGEIEIDGKTVAKVMVEGKDFFDGDTKLATKNIPADAVKKIEVLKNYNEVSQMRGVGDDSENIAINIKLKEGKKSFWFGEVTAGIGQGDDETRYLAHPKLFYYSPKKSINVITDINNIGEIPFTAQDYFKFSGGFKNMMRSGGIRISSNSLGLSFLKDNKAKEIANKFAAINFSQSLNKHLNFNGFAIFSGSENELQTNSKTTYLQNTTITEGTENIITQDNNLGLVKLSLAYKPHAKFQLDYDVLTKISDLSESNYTNSSAKGIITSNKTEKPFSINQNTNMYYTLNDKNIFSFSAQYLYEKNEPLYNSISGNLGFPEFFILGETVYNIFQNKTITTSQLQGTLDYYYILNKKSNINITLGSVSNSQKYTTNISRQLDDDSIIHFSEANLNNDLQFNFSDVFVGLHYKLRTGIVTLTPGISAHQYVSKNEQLGRTTKKSPFYFLPDFTAKIALKRSENIRLNYSIQTSFSDINKLAEGAIFNGYNSMFFGNRELENALYHKYSIRYFNFNAFNFTNIHANVSYTKKYNNIKSIVQNPISIERRNSYRNAVDPEDNLSTRLHISKHFGKMKVKVSGNLSVANTNRLLSISNEIISKETKYTTQNYSASVSTNFREWPNFELGYKARITEQDTAKSTNHKLFGNIEIVFNDFIFTSDYGFNQFTDNSGNTNTYDFLNTDLYYQKEGSKWEFKASVLNLLDTKSINDTYFSTEIISVSKYMVQPRYVMFSVKYDL